MNDISELFGVNTFSDSVMRSRLPESVYKSLKATSHQGMPLDPEIADVVASAMKDWAISLGATHYSHWFHPLSNIVAGKHDSFLSFSDLEKGTVVSEFSASALVQGEPDASSFPSGGLRATFEARGYTAWDPSSPVFVRDSTLYIPTAFCAYTGEALDTKTPLLRAMQALAPQALRILRCLGNTTSKMVIPTVGAEQEYFLIDREQYEHRLDLKLCGRTLFGAKPPKGQELDDHYCGRIRLRVADFMRDLDEQLWKLGIPSKTKHNEVAPAQHELAPVFETVNIACDHNLLTMEMLRITAKRHGLACLLHEKPFEGVNGSGKHNNFSICTDDGINFLSPGKQPEENMLFLLTLCALIEAVDTYADLLRLAAATPGNDARLGGCEAPPAIISIFLGDKLTGILHSIAQGIHPDAVSLHDLNADIDVLPNLKMDDSDRNRTSPFAFTGNKFEFRMLGSSQNIAFVNVVLCTAVADVFCRFADRLEAGDNMECETAGIIADTISRHGRILYNGNNYTDEWSQEAKRRNLPVVQKSVDAFDCMIEQKNIALFARHGIFNETECRARHEILLENFIKVVTIEAETMLHMAHRQIFPAAADTLGRTAEQLNSIKLSNIHSQAVASYAAKLSHLTDNLGNAIESLQQACGVSVDDLRSQADWIETRVRVEMHRLREISDELESILPADSWPIPTYTDLLYRI